MSRRDDRSAGARSRLCPCRPLITPSPTAPIRRCSGSCACRTATDHLQWRSWIAARHKLPAASPIASPDPLPIHGVVGLAAISDLGAYARGTSSCCRQAPLLMGGTPDSLPDRYAEASPIAMLPLGMRIRLVHG